ncbi:KICSTOR complex protein SZT2-like isoform X2 [Oncorhynchus keta]|uniref:KICSTOR complex protein SZT2-like isoform X2 n=1 Tax=Oncorhynchus keta TaxID=8018 RepID=UPI00227B8B70|nr:KICSTOR complex protein SZT2-like isoform X2 [Oncorhynchus keta]XP_052316901.1 KICSTOR complex protein SZT2-like isoform X2 [Oncorhynchus keta]XP_052316902.1 KICSTOR complex protein SZT2-like isoform X2 [Oncorhynchus keta]XP_052316906.1 KICSTOR complex protein SZT2-like isoform X2 [Oncorhynchus keta]XP_052316915.1 KICSTOR complex protein SZT2-like isoform X2 [Oncorhynchus keta]XP_052316917.1 KICSTOR complex protein SZT2-like isoform X2 [Oncorhynchus keta]XP_052316922.1 KICSTOR complex prot
MVAAVTLSVRALPSTNRSPSPPWCLTSGSSLRSTRTKQRCTPTPGASTKGDGVGEEEEVPEYLQLHQMVVRKIGEIFRIVNQRLLLQDLNDSHVCNFLLVAESEEDIWKNESLYRQRLNNSDDYNAEENYQPRDYLAATMQFFPVHFACEVLWSTVIHIHPRLKVGTNVGVFRAIQALRSVLNALCVVNRKSMFVYQERTTKSVFYLRLCETSQTGKYCETGWQPTAHVSPGARSPSSLRSSRAPGHLWKVSVQWDRWTNTSCCWCMEWEVLASMSSPWTSSVSTSWTSDSEASSSLSLSNLVEDGSLSGSKSLKFAWMANNFSTLVLVSLLHALVCVPKQGPVAL